MGILNINNQQLYVLPLLAICCLGYVSQMEMLKMGVDPEEFDQAAVKMKDNDYIPQA